jgi:uncharacterized protein YbaP (TraB family)
MFRTLAALLICLLSTAAAHGRCQGEDQRPGLTPAERAEIDARLADTPYAEGNFWTARRGVQTFHVFGTMHLDDPRFDALMPSLAPLVRNADLLLVEATAEEKAALSRAVADRPELLFLTNGPTLPELLPEDDWQALAAAANARGLPGFMAAKMQPWYLSIMLTMPGCMVAQMQGETGGLDARIMDVAEAAGVPQRALEPYDTLFNLMGETPLEEQVRYLTLGVLPDDVAEDSMTTLANGYFEQKSAEIVEVNRIIAQRVVDLPKAETDALLDEMMATLLVRRNLAWMEPILSAPDGVTVIAAGAAHLPGRQGILALLEAEGFALERLPF